MLFKLPRLLFIELHRYMLAGHEAVRNRLVTHRMVLISSRVRYVEPGSLMLCPWYRYVSNSIIMGPLASAYSLAKVMPWERVGSALMVSCRVLRHDAAGGSPSDLSESADTTIRKM